MPEIMALALFERGGRVLVAQRKAGGGPFAGQWMLPGGLVGGNEAMEESLERHLFHELGAEVNTGSFVFAETLYVEDPSSGRRYVANVFRLPQPTSRLRFRSAGDYEDARWLTDAELAEVSMAPGLRSWLAAGRKVRVEAAPVPSAASGPAPDNRSGWNSVSRAYQERYKISTTSLEYGPRCPDESELGLIGDVAGKRAIVLGCGGGQDCIVLAKQGAQVIGIDLSDKQIEYGRRLAEREAVEVTLLQGNVQDLGRIDDASQDIAVSVHALNYVERCDDTFAETFRVLRPGSAFIFSVHHPFDASLDDAPPFGVVKSYWTREVDWQWEFSEAKVTARMRSWYRTVGEWVTLLTEAGFRVERLLEPEPLLEGDSPWDGGYNPDKIALVPGTLIIKAVKP